MRPLTALLIALGIALVNALLPLPARAGGRMVVTEPIASPLLAHARALRIWLPPGYDADAARRYPVLYIHDAQNVFEAATSFSGVSWGLRETAERLIAEQRIEPFIAVGIDNTAARIDEYSPCCDATDGGGKLDAYARFLAETVKPMIDARYRTRPGARDTAVMGSSLGALASIQMALNHPRQFGKVAALSTSFWWGGEMMVRRLATWRGPRPAVLYFDTGTDNDTLTESQHAADALQAAGWQPGRDFTFHIEHGAKHHESSWAARLERPLRLLFGCTKPAHAATATQP